MAAPFIALVLAVIQSGLIVFATHSLQTAVADASRLIMTGQAQTQSMNASAFAQAVCAKAPLFNCGGLMIDVQTYSSFAGSNTSSPTLTFDPKGQVTNSWQFNPGGPGDIVVMRVMYQWPVFLGPLSLDLSNLSNGNRLLMATAAFKNEPYK